MTHGGLEEAPLGGYLSAQPPRPLPQMQQDFGGRGGFPEEGTAWLRCLKCALFEELGL